MIRKLAILLLLATNASLAQDHTDATPPDLTKQPTLYVVGYAHLDTEWRWEYPLVISYNIPSTRRRARNPY